MTLQEIKKAVDEGKVVHCGNSLYEVINGGKAGYLIRCTSNDHCIGLTWQDGVTMNGEEEDFYINNSKLKK